MSPSPSSVGWKRNDPICRFQRVAKGVPTFDCALVALDFERELEVAESLTLLRKS